MIARMHASVSGDRAVAVLLIGAAALVLAASLRAQAPPPVEDMAHPQGTNAGIFAFTGACASCHDTGKDRAPDRYALNAHTPEEVLATISSGPHAVHAEQLSEFTKRVVAVYVGGRPLGAAAAGDKSAMKGACTTTHPFAPLGGSEWNGWGADLANTRYQPTPGLTAGDVPKPTGRHRIPQVGHAMATQSGTARQCPPKSSDGCSTACPDAPRPPEAHSQGQPTTHQRPHRYAT